MKQLLVMAHAGKRGSVEVVRRIWEYYRGKEVRLVMARGQGEEYGKEGLPCVRELHLDMALSIGGDGTFLGVSRYLGYKVPVCGVNLGRVGFLADIEPVELEMRLGQILSGEYRVEERSLLRGEIRSGLIRRDIGEAINEIVVSKSGVSRLLDLELWIGGEYVQRYAADGVIVSSGTGSTGYSLSAGGPIMNPEIHALLITPICVHTFGVRPMIVSEESEVRIVVKGGQEVVATLDGQVSHRVLPGEEVVVSRALKRAQVVKFEGKGYYDVLKSKLFHFQGTNG